MELLTHDQINDIEYEIRIERKYIDNLGTFVAQAHQANDLTAENERLKAEKAELLEGNERIHSIIDGTIKMSGDTMSMIRVALVEIFKESGAVNFLIQNLIDTKDGAEYQMIIQKKDALSVESKFIIVDNERLALKTTLAEIEKYCRDTTTYHDNYACDCILGILKGGTV